MSLSDFMFQASYNKADDDIAELFYLPCMRTATGYDRISGYFGSTVYIVAWSALKEFVSHGGKMRLICSPYISDTDEEALATGYSARGNQLLEESIRQEVEDLFASEELSAPAKVLSYLVAEGIVDVKIAVPGEHASAETKRLFHDKVGIFTDGTDATVGFRGSMNETFKGLSSDGNIESIDVFLSWADTRDQERVETAKNFFSRLWINTVPGVVVYPFPAAVREVLKNKAKGADWEKLLDEIKVVESAAMRWRPDKRPGKRNPRKHQTNALDAWLAHSRRGIFEHATGSGKTFTAECAIVEAFSRGETILILVPSRDLLAQWYKELKETLSHLDIYYMLCGDGNDGWRKHGELRAWTSPGTGQNRIIISTMDTASNPQFIHNVAQGEHLFLIADEVHRVGSPERRRALTLEAGARLGLSATPRRYGDSEGTAVIFDYFDGVIPPPFTLEDAIHSDVLTHYYYHPQKLYLTESEQHDWNNITDDIKRHIARTRGSSQGSGFMANPRAQRIDERLKQLLIARARIVKNAAGKVQLAMDVLSQHYKYGQKWIVYCDNQVQMRAVLDHTMALGLDAIEYHADMEGDREATLKYFASNGGVLVSIKCLDEGVDIPSTTHALILASSQNPREFIQRRGRILRRADGKVFAELYDAITMPLIADSNDPGLSIITAELARAIQFGQGAENKASCTADLKLIAIDYRIDPNIIDEGGVEDDDQD